MGNSRIAPFDICEAMMWRNRRHATLGNPDDNMWAEISFARDPLGWAEYFADREGGFNWRLDLPRNRREDGGKRRIWRYVAENNSAS